MGGGDIACEGVGGRVGGVWVGESCCGWWAGGGGKRVSAYPQGEVECWKELVWGGGEGIGGVKSTTRGVRGAQGGLGWEWVVCVGWVGVVGGLGGNPVEGSEEEEWWCVVDFGG